MRSKRRFAPLTPDARYPIASISIQISPDMVDVNVHPTKTEVKFTRDGELHHAVSQAVKGALLAYGIVPIARVTVSAPLAPEAPQGQLNLTSDRPERHAGEAVLSGISLHAGVTSSGFETPSFSPSETSLRPSPMPVPVAEEAWGKVDMQTEPLPPFGDRSC